MLGGFICCPNGWLAIGNFEMMVSCWSHQLSIPWDIWPSYPLPLDAGRPRRARGNGKRSTSEVGNCKASAAHILASWSIFLALWSWRMTVNIVNLRDYPFGVVEIGNTLLVVKVRFSVATPVLPIVEFCLCIFSAVSFFPGRFGTVLLRFEYATPWAADTWGRCSSNSY